MTDQNRHQKFVKAMQFGRRVGSYRFTAGLTQTQATQRAKGISRQSWSDIESGNSNPLAAYQKALARLQTIASVLGVTLDDLIKPLN